MYKVKLILPAWGVSTGHFPALPNPDSNTYSLQHTIYTIILRRVESYLVPRVFQTFQTCHSSLFLGSNMSSGTSLGSIAGLIFLDLCLPRSYAQHNNSSIFAHCCASPYIFVSGWTVRDDLRLTKVAPGYFVLTGAQSMFHEKHMDLGEPERWMLLNWINHELFTFREMKCITM